MSCYQADIAKCKRILFVTNKPTTRLHVLNMKKETSFSNGRIFMSLFFLFHFQLHCSHIEIKCINGNIFSSYALFTRKLDTIATFPLSCNVTSNSPFTASQQTATFCTNTASKQHKTHGHGWLISVSRDVYVF